MPFAAAAALAAACGGRTELSAAGAAADACDGTAEELELPAGVAPPLAGCSAPLPVPRGKAWIGSFRFDAQGRLSPIDACEPPWHQVVARRVVVRGFFVDRDEVANACYRHCVEAGWCAPPPEFPELPHVPGPWTDPALQDHPVHADFARAAILCAWRGGRLPTLAELVRASHGDEPSVCKPELLRAWVDCFWSSFESAGCQALERRATGFEPIRSYAADIGPFGHYDLFGARDEISATRAPSTAAEAGALCALDNDMPDPKSLGTSTISVQFGPAMGLYISQWLIEDPEGGSISNAQVDPFDELPELRGFRCAYDPVR
ncbi:MAG: SUMF1/EgtB/PvdO family nonheme iron enzyme [Deltaproteobacteria bacterium]|nr:SUMF1/EgtB/PvdO family nonheme iron enzyme [Deltaproteobacteria bacterium]